MVDQLLFTEISVYKAHSHLLYFSVFAYNFIRRNEFWRG